MIERIETFFRHFISCLQITKLYTTGHPRFNKFLNETYESLQRILAEKDELVLGIVGNELAFEKEIFFDLSKNVSAVINYLKERKIEKIVFSRGVNKEELSRFFDILVMSKEELAGGIESLMLEKGIKKISAGSLKSSDPKAQDLDRGVDFPRVYNDSFQEISQATEAILTDTAVEHLNLRFNIKNLLENLILGHGEILSLATLRRYDFGTFTHALNVSILAMYLSGKLGFSKDDCFDIGIAALFHDMGKLSISRRIIQKKGSLSEEEFSKMKSHVVLGSEILLKHVNHLGVLPVVVSYEHHLRYDLKGYPKVGPEHRPHVASLIVALCDVYDSLSQRRSYKNDYPPDMVHGIMQKERGLYFDPYLFDRFFEIMGIWPIGSIVSLSDDSIAVVKEENEADKASPKVEILLPERAAKIIDLMLTKDSLKIERFLNPWSEGKEYLPLIQKSPKKEDIDK